jgi:hypothetical protein
MDVVDDKRSAARDWLLLVCTQPSQSAEARRVAQQAHAAAVDGGSQHFAQGPVERQERLLQRSCIAHRLCATVNQQLARPVTQSGEDEWSPRLNYRRLAARGARRAVYKCNTSAALTFVCRRLFLRYTAIAAYLIRCGTCCNGTRHLHISLSTLHHVPTRAHVGAKARAGASKDRHSLRIHSRKQPSAS